MWIVEIETGADHWTPIVHCWSSHQAEAISKAPHIIMDGRPVRIRKYGQKA